MKVVVPRIHCAMSPIPGAQGLSENTQNHQHSPERSEDSDRDAKSKLPSPGALDRISDDDDLIPGRVPGTDHESDDDSSIPGRVPGPDHEPTDDDSIPGRESEPEPEHEPEHEPDHELDRESRGRFRCESLCGFGID